MKLRAVAAILTGVMTSAASAQWTVTSLHPGDAGVYAPTAIAGMQQTGYVTMSGMIRAGFWSGTAASWVDLHPPTASSHSYAYGTSGTHQVGRAWVGGVLRASLWSGTAASWVDLHPPGATSSVARAA